MRPSRGSARWRADLLADVRDEALDGAEPSGAGREARTRPANDLGRASRPFGRSSGGRPRSSQITASGKRPRPGPAKPGLGAGPRAAGKTARWLNCCCRAGGGPQRRWSTPRGNAVCAAKTSEIRARCSRAPRAAALDPYDLVWKDEDDEVMRRVTADPKSAELGNVVGYSRPSSRAASETCCGVLLDAGIRVPPARHRMPIVSDGAARHVFVRCWESGMNPDTCNWQMQTMLHLCWQGGTVAAARTRSSLECAAMLLDAGANILARDDDYTARHRWDGAARHNRPDMVDFLLSPRGAKKNLPDDKPWATPLAWAKETRAHAGGRDVGKGRGAGVRCGGVDLVVHLRSFCGVFWTTNRLSSSATLHFQQRWTTRQTDSGSQSPLLFGVKLTGKRNTEPIQVQPAIQPHIKLFITVLLDSRST